MPIVMEIAIVDSVLSPDDAHIDVKSVFTGQQSRWLHEHVHVPALPVLFRLIDTVGVAVRVAEEVDDPVTTDDATVDCDSENDVLGTMDTEDDSDGDVVGVADTDLVAVSEGEMDADKTAVSDSEGEADSDELAD